MKKEKNILLVDDNKSDQLLFKMALEEIKYTTPHEVANDGHEALAMLRTSTTLPDIIFMDINMPGMNGMDCLAEIKKDPQINHIPVVMLSSDIAHAEQTRQLGAKAFIQKPWDGQLHQQLEKMISLDFSAPNHEADQSFFNFL